MRIWQIWTIFGAERLIGGACRERISMRENQIESFGQMKPGQALLAAGYIGLRGTAELVRLERVRLEQRFAPQFVRRCGEAYQAYLHQWMPGAESLSGQGQAACSAAPDEPERQRVLERMLRSERADMSGKLGASSWCPDGEGGVLAALWDYFEAFGLGFDLEFRKLPIRQETVEVCEALAVNPYRLWSGGCVLMTSDDGAGLLCELEKQGIPAVLLGRTTADRGRRLHNGEIHTYLDRPGRDELLRYIEEKDTGGKRCGNEFWQ